MQDGLSEWHRWSGLTRHRGLEIRRALDITLSTRHQVPADGSAVILDSRYECSLVQDNRLGCREFHVAREIAIEVAFSLVDGASLIARRCGCGLRYYRWLGRSSFGCHCRSDGGSQGGRVCGCGRHLCRGDLIAVGLTCIARTFDVLTDSSAAILGDSDWASYLPFGEDRLSGCYVGVDGAHQAHKAKSDRLGDTHFADWVRLMDSRKNFQVVY